MVDKLDNLYNRYNKFEYIHPDPLELVYKYESKQDREVVGLISSSFAIGNVKAILKFLYSMFEIMGDSPSSYIKNTGVDKIKGDLGHLYYRYYSTLDVLEFILVIKGILEKYGDLETWVMEYYREEEDTIALLLVRLSEYMGLGSSLIPKANGKSGFKRMALFFRWMVRKDGVDLGLWTKIGPEKLIIPLDTHIMNISHILGLTSSRSNSMKNALIITNGFKNMCAYDPIKWDFSLSRLGIHPDLNYDELIKLF
jgi:uncharacterized protein (TIGR02757 family)